jgi:hypothetical protein
MIRCDEFAKVPDPAEHLLSQQVQKVLGKSDGLLGNASCACMHNSVSTPSMRDIDSATSSAPHTQISKRGLDY